MRRCDACKGERGVEITDPDGSARWIICSPCGGVGELPDNAPVAAPKPRDDEPPHPLDDRPRDDIWITGLLESAYKKVEHRLPRGPGSFESMFVNHHEPFMERLFFEEELRVDPNDLTSEFVHFRVVLNRIFPTGDPDGSTREALAWRHAVPDYHSHVCPASVRILEGGYENKVGTAGGPLVTTRQEAGTCYAMTDPRAWHSVQAWNPGAYTLMVQGTDYPKNVREEPTVPVPKFEPLGERQKIHLWWNLCRIFGVEPDAE